MFYFVRVSLFVFAILSFDMCSALRVFKFKSVQCSSSNKTVDGLSCVLNRYSKSNSSLSISMNFIRKAYNLTVRNNETKRLILKQFQTAAIWDELQFPTLSIPFSHQNWKRSNLWIFKWNTKQSGNKMDPWAG